MRPLIDELLEQPAFLRTLAADYRRSARIQSMFTAPAAPERWTLTGMGASYHAAWIGSMHLNHLGIPAGAFETTDLMNYSRSYQDDPSWLVYVSQSGASGEIVPFLDRLDARKTLVSITNNPTSELARQARWFLPIDAGDENLVASKTYVNPLAILWLLARQAAGLWDGGEYDTLQAIADRAEQILTAGRETAARLADTFEPCSPLLFLGHGPHGVTARQAAMMMSEWAKLPALHAGIGAFRHGFIETVRPGFGVVIFAAPGCSSSSALELAGELESYGARVLLIENGRLRSPAEALPAAPPVDEFLSPILDVIPIQLYTEELARRRGIEPGFRYISKVVQRL